MFAYTIEGCDFMKFDFQLDFLNTVILLKTFDGKIVKANKELPDSFFQMHLLKENIYLDGSNNYWKKDTKIITYGQCEYYQEEYVNVTNYYLKNRKLMDDLKKDPLTKISNVNAVLEKVNNIVMSHQDCIIVMCDVNDFKNINDTYGHTAGDRALGELSQLFSKNSRGGYDMVARVGGDEFLFIFISDDEQAILDKLYYLKEEVVNLGADLDLPLSISFGIATFSDGDDWMLKQNEADGALYHVKHNINGKNAIARFDTSSQEFVACNRQRKLYFKQ